MAVSNNSGVKDFFIDTSDKKWNSTGSLIEKGWNNMQPLSKIQVKAITMSELLMQYTDEAVVIDLLKMDIEGMEQSIISNCVNLLPRFRNIIIEFHESKIQNISKIIGRLNKFFNCKVEEGDQKGLSMIYCTNKQMK